MKTDTTQPQIRIVDGDRLDVEAHAALQLRVFGHILEDNDIPPSRLSAEVFAWKLNPPTRPARLGVAEHNGQLLSSVTAYPVTLSDNGRPVQGWHLCDAVTAPEARGQGLYHRVLTALCDSFPHDEWLFGFPNTHSKGAFERQGFFTVKQVPLWFRPVIGRGPAMPKDVMPVDEFGPAYDELGARLATDRGMTLLRSHDYLTWRYLKHPFFAYESLALQRGDHIDGLAVVNRMEARGRVSMWVMELMAMDRAGERTLAKAIRARAAATGCDVVLAISSAKLPGALRLPSLFLPKKNILVVRTGSSAPSKAPGQWEVYTGDWDTF